MDRTMDKLLVRIHKEGWTDYTAERFHGLYAERIKWTIATTMERLGLIQSRLHPKRIKSLSTRRVELFENTWSDLWIELLNGLVKKYMTKVEKGAVHQEFFPYLVGVIRHLVIKNARELGLVSAERPEDLLRAIGEARNEAERRARIAWAKFVLENKARFEILSRCPRDRFQDVYRSVHHVSDYLFERYIPSRGNLAGRRKSWKLTSLVEEMLESNLDQALTYSGEIAPYGARVGAAGVHSGEEDVEDEYLSALKCAIGV